MIARMLPLLLVALLFLSVTPIQARYVPFEPGQTLMPEAPPVLDLERYPSSSAYHNRMVYIKAGTGYMYLIKSNGDHFRFGPYSGYSDAHVADLDNDEEYDIVAANPEGGFVRALSPGTYNGDWDGMFVDQDNPGVSRVSSADIDDDGDLDILAGGESVLCWYELETGPVFTRHLIATEYPLVGDIVPADYDGDGDIDIAVLTGSPTELTIWENADTGFVEHVVATVPEMRVLAGLDMDVDGLPDLAAGGLQTIPQLFTNQGNWVFTSSAMSSAATTISDFAVHDWDADGDPDLASAHPVSNRVGYFENQGEYGFVFAPVDVAVENVWQVLPLYINTDSYPDLVAGSRTESGLEGWRFSGRGTIRPFTAMEPKSVYIQRFVDFDGDGDVDILASEEDNDRIMFIETLDNLQFDQHILLDGFYWIHFDYADFDSDGDYDVVVADTYYDLIYYENEGDNINFTPHVLEALEHDMAFVKTGDLDSDGDQDFVVVVNDHDITSWYNDGTGQFTSHLLVDLESYHEHRDILLLDDDGDGDLDLFIPGIGVNTDWLIWYYENRGVGEVGPRTILYEGLWNTCEHPIFTDWDFDGDQDIVMAYFSEKTVLENQGGGRWDAFSLAIDPDVTSWVAPIDYDDDGDMDLLELRDEIFWHRNPGGTDVWDTVLLAYAPVDFLATNLLTHDLDGDGVDEIVTAGVDPGLTVWVQEFATGDLRFAIHPPDDTILPATGGALTYHAGVRNQSETDSWAGQIWATVLDPDGALFDQTMGSVYLAPGSGRHVSQVIEVAQDVPAGEYTVDVSLGYFPQLAFMTESFSFTKLPATAAGIDQGTGDPIPGQCSFSVGPNPFNSVAVIQLQLPEATAVKVEVFDVLGRHVATLVDHQLESGSYRFSWQAGQHASGLYFVHLAAGELDQTRKVLLVR